MEYILGILLVGLTGWLLERRLPAEKRPWMLYFWLGMGYGLLYAFLTSPYRLARITSDLARFIS